MSWPTIPGSPRSASSARPGPAARSRSAAPISDLPPGVFNFVTGPGPEIGDELAHDPRVAAIGFIGSTRTGRQIAERGADLGPAARGLQLRDRPRPRDRR